MQPQEVGSKIKKCCHNRLLKRNIYLITPNTLNKSFYYFLPKLLKTKRIRYLQIRLKSLSKKKLVQEIKKIKKIVNKKTKIIINDFPEIASLLNCDGYHLGQKDKEISLVKKKFKTLKIVGVTCHNSKKIALSSVKKGASYVAFGSFYKTSTKKTKFNATVALLRWAKDKIKVPVVAIGGINEHNYQPLLKNGANLIACSSFVWKNKKYNPLQALNRLK